MRNFLRSRSIVGALLFAASLAGSSALPTVGLSQSGPASGRYIVLLRDDVFDPAQIAAEHGKGHGFKESHVYRHALRGYAATLPPGAADAIRKRPEVLSVTEDGEMRLHAEQPPQITSVGVLRIEGDESSTRSGDGRGTVNVNVAVLDTGIAKHVDLNVVGSTSCLEGATDPNGHHGTAVAGLIGALDNKIGRVGIAPGARLWSVQVGKNAVVLNSAAICGLDWVTATRTDADPNNDIAVANLSFGGHLAGGNSNGSCADSPKDPSARAICGAIAAGVVIVAAAGNGSEDFQNVQPATWSEVLAVTAIADHDGQPGGLQPRGPFNQDIEGGCPEIDDTPASFSNFATLPEDKAHTVAAPGVCLASTSPGDSYAVGSGTSFSAPLVSGVVALCIATGHCAGLTPQEIVAKIVADAAAYNAMKKNSGYGFVGDPLRPIPGKYYGHLISAALY